MFLFFFSLSLEFMIEFFLFKNLINLVFLESKCLNIG